MNPAFREKATHLALTSRAFSGKIKCVDVHRFAPRPIVGGEMRDDEERANLSRVGATLAAAIPRIASDLEPPPLRNTRTSCNGA